MDPNIGQYVGVLQEDGQKFMEHKEEIFILAHLRCYDLDIPVLMSKFFYEKFAGQRVRVTAFPKQTRRRIKGERLFYSYLNCIDVAASDCLDESRYIEIEGVVKSSAGIRLDYKNTSKLKFDLLYGVKFNNVANVIVPCSAFDKTARALMDVEKGDKIKVIGYITGNDTHLRIVVQQFERKEDKRS